jgi:hypothetical protein
VPVIEVQAYGIVAYGPDINDIDMTWKVNGSTDQAGIDTSSTSSQDLPSAK